MVPWPGRNLGYNLTGPRALDDYSKLWHTYSNRAPWKTISLACFRNTGRLVEIQYHRYWSARKFMTRNTIRALMLWLTNDYWFTRRNLKHCATKPTGRLMCLLLQRAVCGRGGGGGGKDAHLFDGRTASFLLNIHHTHTHTVPALY